MVWPCLEALRDLKRSGIDLSLVNARFVKPLDKELILRMVNESPAIITVEEGTLCGGFGSGVTEMLVDEGILAKVMRIGLEDRFIEHGETSLLLARYGLDPGSIAERIRTFLKGPELRMVRLERR
jgi:1-deoxy-D-xylulose-5-phosphate synthase